MDARSEAYAATEGILRDMLAADDYSARITSWPEGDRGHPRIEIRADAGACEDCLVPKGVLTLVLNDQLPDGLEVDEADLVYPGERVDA